MAAELYPPNKHAVISHHALADTKQNDKPCCIMDRKMVLLLTHKSQLQIPMKTQPYSFFEQSGLRYLMIKSSLYATPQCHWGGGGGGGGACPGI